MKFLQIIFRSAWRKVAKRRTKLHWYLKNVSKLLLYEYINCIRKSLCKIKTSSGNVVGHIISMQRGRRANGKLRLYCRVALSHFRASRHDALTLTYQFILIYSLCRLFIIVFHLSRWTRKAITFLLTLIILNLSIYLSIYSIYIYKKDSCLTR